MHLNIWHETFVADIICYAILNSICLFEIWNKRSYIICGCHIGRQSKIINHHRDTNCSSFESNERNKSSLRWLYFDIPPLWFGLALITDCIRCYRAPFFKIRCKNLKNKLSQIALPLHLKSLHSCPPIIFFYQATPRGELYSPSLWVNEVMSSLSNVERNKTD